MTTLRSAEASSIAAPTITNPGVLSEMKARQSAKIRELGQALIDAGLRTLDAQADALGLPRSTAWTIVKTCHKTSGLSAGSIERMLASKLPPRARATIVEYVEEKSFGLYGGSRRQQQRFAIRLSNTIASSSGSEEMPRVPAPPAAADGAAFALRDIRWPGWMWCSTLPGPLCQGELENAHRLRVRRLTPELSASPG